MLHLGNGNSLVQSVEELPAIEGVAELFMDFETTSFTPKRGGTEPYLGDKICGIGVTVNNDAPAWYVPIRHTDPDWNMPLEPVIRWLRATVSTCKEWINSNVGNFDAHLAAEEEAHFTGRLIDTVVLAKLIDSDRLKYGLKQLTQDWLHRDIDERDRLKAYLEGIESKNYADAPGDILGHYCCSDVINNRLLYRYILQQYDPAMKLAWENEINLTPVLFDMERLGMPVDVRELKIEKMKSLHKQIQLGDELHEDVGHEVNANSNQQVYDVLINQFALPVLAYNKDKETGEIGNPTFDKDAMAAYMTHPSVIADPLKMRVVKNLKDLRHEIHFMGLFLEPYLNLNRNSILHPSYNQCVRTGRMSCRHPNAQQLNKRAKALIHPFDGYGILCCDYSQIEFRIICHYINDEEAIRSYLEKPDTDFHQWVADICGVKRKAAKCLNFGMGFGAGKAKVVKMLSGNPDVIEAVALQINTMIEKGLLNSENRVRAFNMECNKLASSLYTTYHERLPGIKATSRRAADIAKARGFVFNGYGRRRHLLSRFCYRGFNSVVQSYAADIMKDCTVKLAPRYNKKTRDLGIKLFSSVHDELGMMCPLEIIGDPEVHRFVKDTLEDATCKIKIPIITDMGFSLRNWAEASADDPIVVDGKVVGGPIAVA